MPRRCFALPVLLAVLVPAALTGCSDQEQASAAPQTSPGEVVASRVAVAFYPLQFLAERVGGPAVQATSLTPAGAEPHDVELTPKQVAGLSRADLVLYLRGFQPAVDTAVDQQAKHVSFDVSTVTALVSGFVPIEEGQAQPDKIGDDPHVWLEPLRFADIGDAVATRLSQVQPARAAEFTANARALREDLTRLDAEYTSGLARCTRRQIVTSHNAYGYLAKAYDLKQVPLTGLTPEDEASPATLARVTDYAKKNGVTTIFFEELVSPDIAKTLADEVGAKAVELSPLEGAPTGGDYLTQMRKNLTTLQTALGCTPA